MIAWETRNSVTLPPSRAADCAVDPHPGFLDSWIPHGPVQWYAFPSQMYWVPTTPYMVPLAIRYRESGRLERAPGLPNPVYNRIPRVCHSSIERLLLPGAFRPLYSGLSSITLLVAFCLGVLPSPFLLGRSRWDTRSSRRCEPWHLDCRDPRERERLGATLSRARESHESRGASSAQSQADSKWPRGSSGGGWKRRIVKAWADREIGENWITGRAGHDVGWGGVEWSGVECDGRKCSSPNECQMMSRSEEVGEVSLVKAV